MSTFLEYNMQVFWVVKSKWQVGSILEALWKYYPSEQWARNGFPVNPNGTMLPFFIIVCNEGHVEKENGEKYMNQIVKKTTQSLKSIEIYRNYSKILPVWTR